MKWKSARVLIVVLVLALSALSGVAVVSAAGPLPDMQAWMISASHCGGLGSPTDVQLKFQRYQNAQAELKQWTTAAQWQGAYDDTVTQFVHLHGCVSGGIVDGALTFDFKVSLPTYARDYDYKMN